MLEGWGLYVRPHNKKKKCVLVFDLVLSVKGLGHYDFPDPSTLGFNEFNYGIVDFSAVTLECLTCC